MDKEQIAIIVGLTVSLIVVVVTYFLRIKGIV